MTRAYQLFAGLLGAVLLSTSFPTARAAAGQQPAAEPLKPILAGRKFTAPARGTVQIERTDPVSRRAKNAIITTVQIKNVGTAPIAGLTMNETWFSDAGAVVSGGRASINGLLQPGEVKTLTSETPFKPGMSRSSFTFKHANGDVKDKRVAKLTPAPASTPAK